MMAKEISLHGRKQINTIREEFNEAFSYLRLSLFPSDQRDENRKIPFSGDQTLASVREVDNPGSISIHGRTLVKNIEKQFDDIYGLYAQVCYTEEDGKRRFSGSKMDQWSLSKMNKYGQENGWQQNEFK